MVNENLATQVRNREINGSRINYRESNPKEKCIICGVTTVHRKNTHVENRGTYVQGCGQLCNSCYAACYNTSTVDWYMNYLIE